MRKYSLLRTWEQNADVILCGAFAATQFKRTPQDDFWTHELSWTQELRLADSKLIWQTGALYYN